MIYTGLCLLKGVVCMFRGNLERFGDFEGVKRDGVFFEDVKGGKKKKSELSDLVPEFVKDIENRDLSKEEMARYDLPLFEQK